MDIELVPLVLEGPEVVNEFVNKVYGEGKVRLLVKVLQIFGLKPRTGRLDLVEDRDGFKNGGGSLPWG